MGQRCDSGKWTFIAGHIDDGESPKAAAKRELFEEAGLTCESMKLGYVEMTDKALVYVFECKVSGEPTHLNDPDKEFDRPPEYKDPFLLIGRLHFEPPDNIALKYLCK